MIEPSSAPALKVTIESGSAERRDFSFTRRFRIGRHPDCEICLKDNVVSRQHAELFFEGGRWWIQDLQSSNGIYIEGQRTEKVPLTGTTRIRLGIYGPSLLLAVEIPAPPEPPAAKPPVAETPSLSHYKEHYFGNIPDETIGEHTMMVRRAYAEVKKKQRWTYISIISFIVILLIMTGAVAFYKHREVVQQRKLAEEIFYTMRALEIDYLKMRMEAEQRRSLEAKKQIDEFKTKKQRLEKSYARYVDTLEVYRKGLSEEERITLRMAHRFGECEINMPDGFAEEVAGFIEKWKSTRRFERMIRRAKKRGYIPTIVKILSEHDLPPQFFYLALQESNLNPEACGPPTRFGIAKGMWQFIPATAEKYGLRTGPMKEKPVVDVLDERHSFSKSTRAAARYLRDIYTTDAQASGLLVMASYNWGEDRVIKLIQSMPSNPRERNFWQLISKYRRRIPDETYDYVFSIFAAAVIGENPRLFGFDLDNPLATAEGSS
jgi:hypothetical protein